MLSVSMKIILCGYMCSGKTSVGNLLSGSLQIPLIDLDQEISKRERKSIPEIFQKPGEIYFRRRESEVLREILASDRPVVLSLGGGTPCYGSNLEMIKSSGAVMVYLETSLPELKSRIMKERGERPLLEHLRTEDEIEDFLRKHLFERNPYYRESDLTIRTDGKSATEIAGEIQSRLM